MNSHISSAALTRPALRAAWMLVAALAASLSKC
jgi:hypothetical protein